MAPLRKARSVNKRYSDMNEVSPSKDVENSKSGNNKKRKLSDMLGPQWNKEELTRFYEAYRNHGKDWKKVAAAVRHRSVETVEALYTMNRAYLSLPEGVASVVGLIAMMTDHYSNMVGSDTEQESDDGVGTSVKPQKRARSKIQPSTSTGFGEKYVFHTPTAASGHSYPALTKNQGTRGSSGSRPVGKRTPRYPISRSNENVKGEKFYSLTRTNLTTSVDNNEDDFTHKIALALAEASKRGDSPEGSQTPNKRTEVVMPSPACSNAKIKHSEVKTSNAKLIVSDVDEEDLEADTGELSRQRILKKQSGQVGKLVEKRRKNEGKKVNINDGSDFDDNREACSGTEEGHRSTSFRRTLDADANIQIPTESPQSSKKRSKKALFIRDDPDDYNTFDALNTLAALSTLITNRELENESSTHVNDEDDDLVDESGYSEAMPLSQTMRDKCRSPGLKHKGDDHSKPREGVVSKKMLNSGKASNIDYNIVTEVQKEGHHSKAVRKKPKHLPKIFVPDVHVTGHTTESQDSEAKDQGKTSKNKRPSQISSKKEMKGVENSSSIDPRVVGNGSTQTTSQATPDNDNALSTKVKNRRKSKMGPKKSQMQSNLHDSALTVQEKLSNCLSNDVLRRWCKCEWFYSAIDYPWYAKEEFVEYLNHVGLGHVQRLTRVEWGVIRGSLGKARRFSAHFLKEEKIKINQYRESVRKHYADLREGAHEGLPTDLARPLSVGQRVIAVHPKTRELHDGSVLTVEQSRCRVQFDRPELGVEFVTDIDCMPLNPLENIPSLNARHVAVDKLLEKFNELRKNDQAKECIKPSCDEIESLRLSHLSKSTNSGANLIRPKVVFEDDNQQNNIEQHEADLHAIAEVTRALDKKEAVVVELRRLNEEVLDNSTLRDSDSFKKQYANVLVLLQEANLQVSSSVNRMRERNAYQDAVLVCPYEAGSQMREIIETSRLKARSMVNVAMKAVSLLQLRENVFDRIEEKIDFVNEQLPLDDSIQPVIDVDLKKSSDKDGAQIASELITRSLATLMMIQKCTERQFPPAEVAQILESAVGSLKPFCSQNLAVYSEIQKCMGMIRSHILALIPT